MCGLHLTRLQIKEDLYILNMAHYLGRRRDAQGHHGPGTSDIADDDAPRELPGMNLADGNR